MSIGLSRFYPWAIETMVRDDYRCRDCGKLGGINSLLLVHHIDPAGNDAPNNLMVVCSDCHALRHGLKKNDKKYDIKELRRAGMSLPELGRMFRITRQRIFSIVKNVNIEG